MRSFFVAALITVGCGKPSAMLPEGRDLGFAGVGGSGGDASGADGGGARDGGAAGAHGDGNDLAVPPDLAPPGNAGPDGTHAIFAIDPSRYLVDLASDGTYLYLVTAVRGATESDGAVDRIPVDGGTPLRLASVGSGPHRAIRDGATLFVQSSGNFYSINAQTGVASTLLPTSNANLIAFDMAVDTANLYWVDSGGDVWSLPKSGAASKSYVATNGYKEISVHGGTLYFSSGLLGTMPPSWGYFLSPGGAPQQISLGGIDIEGIVADDAAIYVMDRGYYQTSPSNGALWQVSLDGKTATKLVDEPVGNRLYEDARALYWMREDQQQIVRLEKGAKQWTVLAANPDTTSSDVMTIDDAHVFWFNSTRSAIMRCPK